MGSDPENRYRMVASNDRKTLRRNQRRHTDTTLHGSSQLETKAANWENWEDTKKANYRFDEGIPGDDVTTQKRDQ